MAEKTSDAIKYKILRFLDVTGFTVFDPIVRLAFKEEPRKELKAIFQFMLIPIAFVAFCVLVWWQVAPNHKTKSGEVPTPDVVWNAAKINDTFSDREKTKQRDFLLVGEAREQTLAEVESLIETRSVELESLEAELAQQEADYKAMLERRISPLQAKLEVVKEKNDTIEDSLKEATEVEAAKIEAGEGSTEALLTIFRDLDKAKDLARKEESLIKEGIDVIRADKYKPLAQARLDVNAVADDIQFLKKRVDFLSDSNRSMKVAEAKEKLADSQEQLAEAGTAKEAISEAKKVLRNESSIERLETQQYASAMTVYTQIKRSLFTVFIGFITAAVIAIPVGVLCGLSPIAMACLTPVFSIFKPVSPVVWLLIFQIVLGAFFPDPDSHPFFLFSGSLPLIGNLGINPLLIFSACTVAM